MPQDRTIKTLLLFCATILIFGGIHLAQPIIAPVAFALFVIAIVWPVQQALQAKIPKLLALLVTILGVLLVISVLGFLLIWGFSRVVQWCTSNAGRLQALYVRATDWLDGHGISVADIVSPGYNNTRWVLLAVKGLGGRGYWLISFVVIAFAFTVLGGDLLKRGDTVV